MVIGSYAKAHLSPCLESSLIKRKDTRIRGMLEHSLPRLWVRLKRIDCWCCLILDKRLEKIEWITKIIALCFVHF